MKLLPSGWTEHQKRDYSCVLFSSKEFMKLGCADICSGSDTISFFNNIGSTFI